jgi:glycosyltransferase involved in cell wall biosynthesis
VDDGSTDATPQAVREIAAGSPMTVRYFRRERDVSYGPGIARAEAVRQASGRFIVFFDDDCIADAAWLRRVYGHLQDGQRAIVVSNIVCDEPLIFPWKFSPVGHTGFLAFDRRATGDSSFSPDFVGKCGNDIDFICRLEDRGFRPALLPDLVVHHPPHRFGLRRVMRNALTRSNEVLLHKKYGRRIDHVMHPFFRPVLFGRLSPCFLAALAVLAGAALTVGLLGWRGAILMVAAVLSGCAWFISFGYRFCVTNAPAGFRLAVGDRFRTLAALSVHVPTLLAARINGSIRHRHLML